jgi:hypothetical protein
MSTQTYTRPATIEIPQLAPTGASERASGSVGASASERLRDATAAAAKMPRAAMVTAASGLVLVIALAMMPWFQQQSLEGAPATSINGLGASHLRGLVMLACGLLPVAAFGLRAAGVQLGGRLLNWRIVAACGAGAFLLILWTAVAPPVLSVSGVVGGIASALGASSVVNGITAVVGAGATPSGGLYIALIASLGVCFGGQFLEGGPYAAATGTTPAGRFRKAFDVLHARGEHSALAPLVTGPASIVLAVLGCIGHDSALVAFGFLVAIATTVLAVSGRGRLLAGGEELAPVARKQLGLAFAPVFLVVIVVAFAVVSVSHTASLITSL